MELFLKTIYNFETLWEIFETLIIYFIFKKCRSNFTDMKRSDISIRKLHISVTFICLCDRYTHGVYIDTCCTPTRICEIYVNYMHFTNVLMIFVYTRRVFEDCCRYFSANINALWLLCTSGLYTFDILRNLLLLNSFVVVVLHVNS